MPRSGWRRLHPCSSCRPFRPTWHKGGASLRTARRWCTARSRAHDHAIHPVWVLCFCQLESVATTYVSPIRNFMSQALEVLLCSRKPVPNNRNRACE
jgi:hypothetical protein